VSVRWEGPDALEVATGNATDGLASHAAEMDSASRGPTPPAASEDESDESEDDYVEEGSKANSRAKVCSKTSLQGTSESYRFPLLSSRDVV
jgi:hypothetical protein